MTAHYPPTPARRISRRAFLAVGGAALVAGCPADSGPGGGSRTLSATDDAPRAPTETAASEPTDTTRADPATTGDAASPTDSTTSPTDDAKSPTDGPTPTGDGRGETDLDVLDGTPPEITGGWHTFGRGLGNAGYADGDGPTEDVGLYWRQYVEGQFSLREPAVVDDTLYVGSGRWIFALDVRDGTERWTADVGEYAHIVAPTYQHGTVYVGARAVTHPNLIREYVGSLYALDAADGSVQWDRALSITSATTVHDGRVYVSSTPTRPTRRGLVHAFDADSGEEVWRFQVDAEEDVPTGAFGTPALDPESETLYVTATAGVEDRTSGFVLAIDAATGQEVWRADTEGPARYAPVLADGTVYAGDASGRLYAFSTDGEEVWRYRVGEEPIGAAPVLAPERDAICASSVGTLACVNASDGEPRWEVAVEDIRQSGLTVAGDALYVGGVQFRVVDLDSGEIATVVPVDGVGGAYGQPVVVDDAIYVGACVKRGQRPLYDNFVYVMG